MLDVLTNKRLHEDLRLTTICASLLDFEFEENTYDIVLSCYVLHHFNVKQKEDIYKNIYRCLKKNGVFIHGDSMVTNLDQENHYRQIAEDIYEQVNLPFASLHIDAPFCWDHEKEILAASGFTKISLVKECTKTNLYRCGK